MDPRRTIHKSECDYWLWDVKRPFLWNSRKMVLKITLQGWKKWQSEKLSTLTCFNPPAPHLQNGQFVASIWCLREDECITANEGTKGQHAGTEGGVMAHKCVSGTSLKRDSSAPTNNLDYSDPKYSSSLINWGEKISKPHKKVRKCEMGWLSCPGHRQCLGRRMWPYIEVRSSWYPAHQPVALVSLNHP